LLKEPDSHWKWGSILIARRAGVGAWQSKKPPERTHPQTSFPAIRAIIILQWTDDLIIGVGDRKGAGQGRSGRHCLHETVMAAGLEKMQASKQASRSTSINNQATQKVQAKRAERRNTCSDKG
jgi:hypothetical protein